MPVPFWMTKLCDRHFLKDFRHPKLSFPSDGFNSGITWSPDLFFVIIFEHSALCDWFMNNAGFNSSNLPATQLLACSMSRTRVTNLPSCVEHCGRCNATFRSPRTRLTRVSRRRRARLVAEQRSERTELHPGGLRVRSDPVQERSADVAVPGKPHHTFAARNGQALSISKLYDVTDTKFYCVLSSMLGRQKDFGTVAVVRIMKFPLTYESFLEFVMKEMRKTLLSHQFARLRLLFTCAFCKVQKKRLSQGFRTFLIPCTPSVFRQMNMYPLSISIDKPVPSPFWQMNVHP